MPDSNPLLAAFIDAERAAGWTAAEWGLAVRQARSANLLAALAARFDTVPDIVPAMAAKHFLAARNVVEQRNATVVWEARQLRDSLRYVGLQPVLLKGAAYLVADLPLSRHRNFADIDMMVPRHQLADAESQLMLSGWLSTNNDAYDQRYYRQWMHEIPPLQHIRRGTTLDLHHAISPLTARYRAQTDLIFSAAIPVTSMDGVLVLSPLDMILHAATHLFAEGEVDNALRNLIDVSELLCDFQRQSGFDAALATRAFEVGLARPLFYAVRFLDSILQQESLLELKQALESASPGRMALRALDAVYFQVFQGSHPSVWAGRSRWASGALYLRGHWLRMPSHLLIPHLVHKLLKPPEPASPA